MQFTNPNLPTGFIPSASPQPATSTPGAPQQQPEKKPDTNPQFVGLIVLGISPLGVVAALISFSSSWNESSALALMGSIVMIPILALIGAVVALIVRAAMKVAGMTFTRSAALVLGIVLGICGAAAMWSMFQSTM